MSKELRVLILEDSDDDTDLVLRHLRRAGFMLDWRREQTELGFLEALQSNFDIILADHSMPQFSALRALELLKIHAIDIPLIVISGTIGEDLAVQTLHLGAVDYLLKDRLGRLESAVSNALAQKKLRDEQVRSVELFRESEHRFRLMAENSTDFVSVHTPKGDYVYASPACLSLLGYQPEELVGRSAYDFFHSADLAEVIESHQTVLKTPDIYTLVYRILHKAGHYIWFETTIRTIRDPDTHEVLEIHASSRDVTQRKLASLQLQESEQRFRSLFDHSPDVVYSCDIDGRITSANQNIEILTGYRVDELLQLPLLDKIKAQPLTQLRYRFQRAVQGIPQNYEMQIQHKDGHMVEARVTNVPIVVQGRVVGVYGIAKDITEENRRAQEREAIVQVAAALRAATQRSEIMQIVLAQVLDLLNAESAMVVIPTGDNHTMRIEQAFGEATHLTGYQLPANEAVSRQVMESGQIYTSCSPGQEDSGGFYHTLLGHSALVCVPFIAQEKAIGVLWVGRRRPILEPECHMLPAIADIGANALHRASLHEQTERQLQRLLALQSIDKSINTSLDLQQTLDNLLFHITELLPVDAVDVLLLDPATDRLTMAAHRGFKSTKVSDFSIAVGDGIAGTIAATLKNVQITNLLDSNIQVKRAALFTDEKLISYFALPMIVQNQVKGILELFFSRPLEPKPEWQNFIEALASHAAIALHNADLFAQTRRLLQQTQAQARQVQEIIDTVPEGVLLLDHDQRIVHANPLARTYLSLLADVDEGEVLTRLVSQPVDGMLTISPNGQRWHDVIEPQNGLIFEVAARPMLDPEVGGWVLVIRDVTEERQRQQHLQTQDRLATVGQLAAGIAHDFNNIMSVITIYSSMARRHKDPDKRQQYLTTINEQAHHATSLINQILDFSRRSVMDRTEVDMFPFLKEMMKLLERTLPENIHLNFTHDAAPSHTISADTTRLQQVIMNLAVNARDAMPHSGLLHIALDEITVGPGNPPMPAMASGKWIRINISDTGVGMSPDIQARIFEPFFTTKEPGKGTGLGLAQVHGIIKQHGGEISVESEVGRGTKFTIYLPKVVGKVADNFINPQVLPPIHNNCTILLVEDNLVAQVAMQESLQMFGYHVLTANNGQEALSVYREHQEEIDLVLSDMVMPEMGGITLYQTLKAQVLDLKFIIMTGYPLGDEGRASLEGDVVEWIQKPFTEDDLNQRIQACIRPQCLEPQHLDPQHLDPQHLDPQKMSLYPIAEEYAT